jgi:hypothetical protein
VGAPSQFAIARRAQARHDALTCLAPFRPVLLSYLSRVILNQFEGGEVNFERALRSCRAVSRGFQVRDSKVLMRYDPARLRRTRSASYDVICLATQTNARKRSQFTATKPPESGRNDPSASDCLGSFFAVAAVTLRTRVCGACPPPSALAPHSAVPIPPLREEKQSVLGDLAEPPHQDGSNRKTLLDRD